MANRNELILQTLEALAPVCWGKRNIQLVDAAAPPEGISVSIQLPRKISASNPKVDPQLEEQIKEGADLFTNLTTSGGDMSWIYSLSAFVYNYMCRLPDVPGASRVDPPKKISINTLLRTGVASTRFTEEEAHISVCLQNISASLETLGLEEAVREIAGILVHELAHVWQKQVELSFTKGCVALRPLSASDTRLLDGIADVVRICANLSAQRWNIFSVAAADATWDTGNEVTAFFLLWLYCRLQELRSVDSSVSKIVNTGHSLLIPKINFTIMTRAHGAASAFKSQVHPLEPFFSVEETEELWSKFRAEVTGENM